MSGPRRFSEDPIDDGAIVANLEACRRLDGTVNYADLARAVGRSGNGVRRAVARLAREGRIVADPPAFTVPRAPVTKERSLEEIIAHRKAESKRAREYEDYAKLIRINVTAEGPIGLMIFGDPHLDNPGTDFSLFESHLKIAAEKKEYILAGNIGDVRDDWIGRLERLYAHTTISAKETWKLVEWCFRDAGVRWTWLVRGNHDAWAGVNDPLDWISSGAEVGVDGDAGVRIAFKHPNGRETRMHARHDFQGNSQFNPLHALKKEILHGFRDQIVVAGHRHIGADAGDVNGDGEAFQMVRVSGYKISDDFRHTHGLRAAPIHPAALIIVDPSEPDTSRARAWCAPTVEEGADYLAFKRDRFNSRPRPSKRKS